MRWTERYLVYPEGETQPIEWPLSINTLVDLNGHPLEIPLSTAKQIVYRVTGQRTHDTRNGEERYYFLELVPAAELEEWLGS